MKISDLFRHALSEILKRQGLSQKKLADSLGISPILINDFLKGRKNFSEDRMNIIAEHLGFTIFEMLNLGYRLATGSEPEKPEVPIELKDVVAKLERLDQDSLKIIDALADKLPKEDKQ